jgi:uncharacterized RDD family membrane protein YckC
MSAPTQPSRIDWRGRYAGIVTRFGGFLLDVLVIGILFSIGASVLEYVVSALSGDDFNLSDRPVVAAILLAAWVLLYMAYPLSAAGHTLGMATAGVRVVRSDGRELDGWHAILRVVALPLSFLLFGLGFLLIVLRRDRRALHDLIAGTVVVYAWDARPARLGFLSKPKAERAASANGTIEPTPLTGD